MKKEVIIYIHGFNSGPGDKVEYLEKEFPEFKVVGIQLKHNFAHNDFVDVVNIINKYTLHNIHVVGTSLGAFYSLLAHNYEMFKNFNNIHYYLINIPLSPHISLKQYEGKEIEKYKTYERYTLPIGFSEGLEDLKRRFLSFDNLENIDFFLGLKDEIVDFEELMSELRESKQPYRLGWYDRDHRFEDISPIVEKIKDNIDMKI